MKSKAKYLVIVAVIVCLGIGGIICCSILPNRVKNNVNESESKEVLSEGANEDSNNLETELLVVSTAVPTEEPYVMPTEAPTEEPTVVPTEAPTEEPTVVPTEAPTEEPTAVPTEVPTEKPTAAPTSVPTEVPTQVPTAAPTAVPTAVPTTAPTAVPTTAPTIEPPADLGHKHTMVYGWWQEEQLEEEHCLTRGRTVDICAECGYVEKAYHEWWLYSNCTMGEVVWIKEQTCFQDGEYLQYCTKCGCAGETRTTQARGSHVMEQVTVDLQGATCSTEGWEVVKHYCHYCDEATYEEKLIRPINDFHPATSYTKTNEKGETVWCYTCKECGYYWETIY